MLPSQEVIDRLATRIERAFTLRSSTWYRGCSTPRVWSAGAMILLQVSMEDPEIPVDPELFVASQPIHGPFADPWNTLALEAAGGGTGCASDASFVNCGSS